MLNYPCTELTILILYLTGLATRLLAIPLQCPKNDSPFARKTPMPADPLVSVIIPTYNRAKFLPAAIDSVLTQTYGQVELIIVDDGSTDDTDQVLSSYGDRIRVLKQQNAGPAIARNRGIGVATGDIIAFLDSDDQWLPSKLERQVESLKAAGPDVICCLCNCTVLYANGGKTSTFAIADTTPDCATGMWLNPVEVLLNRFVMFNQAIAIRREVLERVGYFDESLRFGEDYELPFRLALEGPWTIIREELVVYHEASPGSWAKAAMREELRLREDLVKIRKRMEDAINCRPSLTNLRSLASRELRREKRELSIARFGRRKLWGAPIAAKALAIGERVRRGLFRRSPFYPRMSVRSMTSP
jgi:glycosyltransferase involved in cell wall biosynthesis